MQLVLQEGGRASSGGRRAKRTRNVLVITELTLVAGPDPNVAVFDVHTMHEQLADSLRDQQTTMTLLLAFGGILSSQLFGVAPFDPVTLAGTVVVLAAITVAACYLPARRAAKLDPAIAIMEQ